MIGIFFPADRIFEKSENLRFSKNQGFWKSEIFGFFENLRFLDFSKIRSPKIFFAKMKILFFYFSALQLIMMEESSESRAL